MTCGLGGAGLGLGLLGGRVTVAVSSWLSPHPLVTPSVSSITALLLLTPPSLAGPLHSPTCCSWLTQCTPPCNSPAPEPPFPTQPHVNRRGPPMQLPCALPPRRTRAATPSRSPVHTSPRGNSPSSPRGTSGGARSVSEGGGVAAVAAAAGGQSAGQWQQRCEIGAEAGGAGGGGEDGQQRRQQGGSGGAGDGFYALQQQQQQQHVRRPGSPSRLRRGLGEGAGGASDPGGTGGPAAGV